MLVRLDSAAAGPLNMAADVALLEAAERGQLGARVYTWDGPWLSLGRYQRWPDVRAEMGDWPWVLRPTGGKAVRHGEDLTVAIAAPLSLLGLGPRDVKAAYRALARPLLSGLRAIGIDAELAENTEWCGNGKRTADCFEYVSGNDIVDRQTGEKVCGCALRLTDRAVLVQASIPLVVARTARSAAIQTFDISGAVRIGGNSKVRMAADLAVRATRLRDALAASLSELYESNAVAVRVGDDR